MNATLFEPALKARCNLAMARVLEGIDAGRANDYAILAWENAHTVGVFEADAVTPPAMFAGESHLIDGWTCGQSDARWLED